MSEDVLIPAYAGSGEHRKRIQNRTLSQWTGLAALGLGLYFQSVLTLGPKARAAALGLVFPGAGYIASANTAGFSLLAVTYLLLLPALFAVSNECCSKVLNRS